MLTDEELAKLERSPPVHHRELILSLIAMVRSERQAKENAMLALRSVSRELNNRPWKTGLFGPTELR